MEVCEFNDETPEDTIAKSLLHREMTAREIAAKTKPATQQQTVEVTAK